MTTIKNLNDLAHLIKSQRLQAGSLGGKMPAQELAQLAGVSRDTIHRLERGEDVSFETAMRVMRVFQLGLKAEKIEWPTLENVGEYYKLDS